MPETSAVPSGTQWMAASPSEAVSGWVFKGNVLWEPPLPPDHGAPPIRSFKEAPSKVFHTVFSRVFTNPVKWYWGLYRTDKESRAQRQQGLAGRQQRLDVHPKPPVHPQPVRLLL